MLAVALGGGTVTGRGTFVVFGVMTLRVQRLSDVNADELRDIREAMDRHVARVSRCSLRGHDFAVAHDELDDMLELLEVARAAIDRQYHAAVIRELDFESLPDDRARAKHVAKLLDGYEARHGVPRPRVF